MSDPSEISEQENEHYGLLVEIKSLQSQLSAVMHSVDKWITGSVLEENPETRAAQAREVALKEIEAKAKRIFELESQLSETQLKLDSCRQKLREIAEYHKRDFEFDEGILFEYLDGYTSGYYDCENDIKAIASSADLGPNWKGIADQLYRSLKNEKCEECEAVCSVYRTCDIRLAIKSYDEAAK